LAWMQTTVPDNESGGVPEQQDQQSGSAGDSGTQLAAATEPKPQTAAAPAPDIVAVEPKASPQGQQTKRMFWIIPNFAAVSADTQVPPLTTGEKYALALK